MKKGFSYILIFLLIIFVITGCKKGIPGTKGGDDTNEDFYKKGEITGCCTPFCTDMIENECTASGGASRGAPCSEVDECRMGCCLPFCQDMKQTECTAGAGYGGDWQDKACKDIEECREVCCTPFYEINTKPECEMLGGKAEEASKCETENVQGTLTIEIYYDDACDCGTGEGFSCTTINGITERLTATFMPDPNPEKSDFMGNYGNIKYLIGEGTYTFSGSGQRTTITKGEYTCEVPPPAYDFKIPIAVTSMTRDDVSGSKTGDVKMTIQEQNDGFHFGLSPDFVFAGTKIRSFVTTGERKSCSDSNEDANTEEMDEDIPVEIDGNLPLDFVSDSLKGAASFELYPTSSMATCEKLTKGTITFNFEKME